MKKDLEKNSSKLYADIKNLIDNARSAVAQTVNAGLTAIHWNVGKRISEDILKNKRADYGEQILPTLSAKLIEDYGNGFSERNLKRMIDFYRCFPDLQIVASAMRQLSWSHFIEIIPLNDELQRDFYAQMCRIEKWSVRTLRKKINSMLFERTAISKKPQELAKLELKELSDNDTLSPDLVFRNPYVLDFLNLKDTFQEKDLEKAILNEIEKFILELGKGFTFVERQKRMLIDGEDFYLDLLFYHRKLKRLIALDLKIGKFKAEYKGKMELYLRWLEENETENNEEQPIGLILCAQGNSEQVELLQLDKTNIRVAEYITEYLPKKLLQEKLHLFYERSKRMIENRE
jgi:predicted nuclease of restriction endonuclease-like (RecB) superfamily